jgi:signal transduction histidine kinase
LGLTRTPFRRPLPDAIFDALSTPIAILNEEGVIVGTNASWRELADNPDHIGLIGITGDNYLCLCEGATGDVSGAAMVKKGLERILTGQASGFERTCHTLRRAFHQYLRVQIKRVDASYPGRLIVAVKDITELTEAQRTARSLGQKILDAEMNERQRFATELHDCVGQNIVSLNLSLSRLGSLVSQTDDVSDILKDMKGALDDVQAQIRTVSYLLQPRWPEEAGGLESAASQFVQGFARRAGLTAEFQARGPCTIDADRQFALFRILQEALVNVHRHAFATAVSVEITNNGAEFILQVKDDGRGLRQASGTPFTPGAGMLGMRARLRQFGGTLKVDSCSAGTTLTASLPIVSENVQLAVPRPAEPDRPKTQLPASALLRDRNVGFSSHSSNQRY